MIEKTINSINLFGAKFKKFIIFLLFIILLTMLMETLSIGMFLPLITSVLSPEKLEKLNIIQGIYNYEFFSEISIELLVVSFFLIVFILRFIILIFCNWYNADFEYKIRNFITRKLYSNYILRLMKNFISLTQLY